MFINILKKIILKKYKNKKIKNKEILSNYYKRK